MTLRSRAVRMAKADFPTWDRMSPAVREYELGQRIERLSRVYTTTYCNFGHRVGDGVPVAHECYVLPPAAIEAEMDGDYARACDIIAAAKPLKTHRGVR